MLSKLAFVLAAIGLFGALELMPAVTAASQPQITVTPFLQNVQLASESSKSFDVVYTNNSSEPRDLSLSVADFGSLDQTGGVAFVGSQFGKLLDKYSLSKWLTLSENSFTVAPHQQKTIQAVVQNSNEMGPGGHYAAIVATAVTPSSNKKNQVSIKQKITSLVFSVKTGGEKYDLRLQKLESNAGVFKIPSEAYLTIKATGNTHVTPRGIVYLKDGAGKVISQGAINEESGAVLPDSTRIFTVKLNKIASSKLWNTQYSLQADYRYDGLDVFASKKANLRVISPALLILLVLTVTAAVFWHKKQTKK